MKNSPRTLQPPQEETLSGPLGAAFLLLITKIYYEKSLLASPDDYPKDYTPRLLEDQFKIFDIIIVGAGPAGAILANRLSEIEHWSILLLEAGGVPTASSEVPAFYYSLRGTEVDWKYQTQQEKNACQGTWDGKCTLSTGRSLGGTSSINNLHYLRALPLDFIGWSDDPQYGWTQDNITLNYKKHERCVENCNNTGEFGTTGELSLNNLNEDNDIKDLIYKGADLMGLQKVTPGQYPGYFDVHVTVRDGVRENFAKAFLKPLKKRDNLAVATNVTVTKILTQIPEDHRISGVLAQINGKEVMIKAKKEVILTAGAVNTAQLLMLSGFGPKDHLKTLNIPTVIDMDVGKNMQDQISALMFVGIDKEDSQVDVERNLVRNTYSYIMHREGDLTKTNINHVIGLINTKKDDVSHPNVMIYHYYFERKDQTLRTFLKSFGFDNKIVTSILKYNEEENLILFMPTLIKPKSRGVIELKSDSPFKPPLIIGNYLSDSEDFETLMSGAKYILAMIETEPFQERGARFLEVDMPNCRNYKYCNEPYLSCAVKNMAVPRSQVIGTATMGCIEHCCRVTNEELLLDGIRHLRIVDGSVMPAHVTGNLEATVAMMAENTAQKIKECWLNV